MAEIKRPNYFTSQFLVEKDFNDEQAYHVGMRRRLNRTLHTSGVIEGLAVTRLGPKEVQISPGIAVDKDGREIVLQDARAYTITTVGNNVQVNLTIAYEDVSDPADRYTQAGVENYVRTTERPLVKDMTAPPATDGSVILLARITLNGQGAIDSTGAINNGVRTQPISRLPIGAAQVGTAQLVDSSVTLAKLAADAKPVTSVEGIAGGAIDLMAQNAISIASNTANKTITISENHSTNKLNPHNVTAAQVGALALADYAFARCKQATIVFTGSDGNLAERTVTTIDGGNPFRAKFMWAIVSYTMKPDYTNLGSSAPAFADLRSATILQSGVNARVATELDLGLSALNATAIEGELCRVRFYADLDMDRVSAQVWVKVVSVTDTLVKFEFGRGAGSIGTPFDDFDVRLNVMIFG